MKTKKIILILLCFLVIPISLSARRTITEIQNIWNDSIDEDRSIPSSPSITIDENNLYIFSEKQLDDLCITIKDLSGNIVYTETANVSSEIEYHVSISTLPKGEYYISVAQGYKHITGIFAN